MPAFGRFLLSEMDSGDSLGVGKLATQCVVANATFQNHNGSFDRKSQLMADGSSGRLLRLPFYHDLHEADQSFIIDAIIQFLRSVS